MAVPGSKSSLRGKAIAAVIVVVVVVVVIVVGIYALGYVNTQANNQTNVNITAVNWAFNGANCWTSSTGNGGVLGINQQFTTTWTFSYNAPFLGSSTCTIQSVAIQTPGFSLVYANTPLVVHTGGSETASVEVQTPGSAFTGVLTIEATVTSP